MKVGNSHELRVNVACAVLVGSLCCDYGHAALMVPSGQFSVTEMGAATYTLPIAVPPGTGGMEPKLAFAYNSSTGNGLLGVGWSLSGLSAVTRCPRTKAQDDVRGGIKFDANDRFCLDGQRLIAISGTYGADGTEYRTERESYAKVVSYGTAGNGPAWFKAWTKAGQILEFGNTADSRIEAQGKATARLWAINRITDTVGNYISVTYTENSADGDYYPNRIDYTGNSATGLAPNASVRFSYEDRPDSVPLYAAGSRINSGKRLTTVTTYVGTDQVMTYTLAYVVSPATQRTRLIAITQCDRTGGCLPATTFKWRGSAGFTFGPKLEAPITPDRIDKGQGLQFGDWNGDGITDVMWYNPDNGINRWYINDGHLGFSSSENPIPVDQIDGAGNLYFGDWNGDGVTDVMWYHKNTGTNSWYVNDGQLHFTKTDNPININSIEDGSMVKFGDWNADGITDLMWYNKDNGRNRWFFNDGHLGFTMIQDPIPAAQLVVPFFPLLTKCDLSLGDWNGDGFIDVMWWNRNSGVNRWYVNDGQHGFTLTENLIPNTEISSEISEGEVHVNDWNGDGVSDVMWYYTAFGKNAWYINDGNLGFTATTNPISVSQIKGGVGLTFGDWNSDGTTDVMWFNSSSGRNRWYVNNGKLGFSLIEGPILIGEVYNGGLYLGDWNGDGATDAMWYKYDDGSTRWYTRNEGVADLLTRIVTGLRAATTIDYAPLTDASVYTKGSGSSYPVVDLQAPLYVVSHTRTEGAGTTLNSTYRYGSLRAEVGGRGLLGFGWQETTQTETGLTIRTDYRQDWPYTGLPNRIVKTHPGAAGPDHQLSRVENTYACLNPIDAAACTVLPGRRYFTYVSQSLESGWDLNGAVLPTVTSTNEFDRWGNATRITVSTGDGYAKDIVNQYDNDETKWHLGRLKRASVTSSTP